MQIRYTFKTAITSHPCWGCLQCFHEEMSCTPFVYVNLSISFPLSLDPHLYIVQILLSCVLVNYMPTCSHGPLRVRGPSFKNHWCKLSSFLLRESIQSTVFLLFSLSALCGLSLLHQNLESSPFFSLPPSCLCVYHSTLTSSPKW